MRCLSLHHVEKDWSQPDPEHVQSLVNTVILDEDIDRGYEPSDAEVRDYSLWLGMALPDDEHLLWISRQALKAPLPEAWKQCMTNDGDVYYFNFATGESVRFSIRAQAHLPMSSLVLFFPRRISILIVTPLMFNYVSSSCVDAWQSWEHPCDSYYRDLFREEKVSISIS